MAQCPDTGCDKWMPEDKYVVFASLYIHTHIVVTKD
jgi:hypothetical protein